MKYFKLPDLGEGLAEAEIVEWHVKEGDLVKVDQLLVSVETAKAIVEVPSPQAGTIAALFGAPGDILHVGEPLVEFAEDGEDSGTVVGELRRAEQSSEDRFIIGAPQSSLASHQHRVRASPAVRALAQRLKIDLQQIHPSHGDLIRTEDVEKAAQQQQQFGLPEPLRGVRRTMAKTMVQSHAEVAPVALYEDADIHDWPDDTDITMRLLHAIAAACEMSPALNAWFDGHTLSRRVFEDVHVGIAVDTDDGLFVPVLRNVRERPMADLREGLNLLRADVKARKIPPAEMQGATITLSNFGTIAGRYASPVVVPPQVAIIGAGKTRIEAKVIKGEVYPRRILPISLSFDHRAATGGEAARFLAAMVKDLEQATLKERTHTVR